MSPVGDKDSAKETDQESGKETDQESAKKTDQKSAKETDMESGKETDQEGAKEPDQEGVKEPDQETVQETAKEDVKDTDKEGVKDVAYPVRLFPAGKAPAQERSMNRYSDITNIGRLHEALGEDMQRYMLDYSVGVIVKFVEREFTWSAKPVHYLLTHHLNTNKKHEI